MESTFLNSCYAEVSLSPLEKGCRQMIIIFEALKPVWHSSSCSRLT